MALPSRPRAVVTGAASGLGRALCLQLARRDARVIAADVDLAGAEETVRAMRGGEGVAVRCDVSKSDQVESLAAQAFERVGGVDLLVNNAGVAVAGVVGEIPLADWEWIVGINLWGVVYGCHHFLPRMRAQGSGHVLNVASAAGLLSGAMMAPCNVTKAGVVALSETLRADCEPHGIGVSVLCPMFFQTNIGKSGRGPAHLDAVIQKLLASGKLTADDVARLALEGCDQGDLYIAPHADGRLLWRMKRLMPERFYQIVPKVTKWQLERMRARS